MFKRTATVVVGLPILILLVYLGGLAITLLCATISILGQRELYVALSKKDKPIHAVGYGFSLVYFSILFFYGMGYPQVITLTVYIIIMQACMVLFFSKLELRDCIGVVYGCIYIPFLLAFIIGLRGLELGQFYVWLIFTSAFGCDTFAYLTGSAIGRHKLTGTPSPSKTWEGLFGGIVGAAFIGCMYGLFATRVFPDQFMGNGFIVQAAAVSAITAVFCVVGDMSASAIKRQTGIKDFGNIFPGHGGVLDRIDSIVIAAPVVYLIMAVIL